MVNIPFSKLHLMQGCTLMKAALGVSSAVLRAPSVHIENWVAI